MATRPAAARRMIAMPSVMARLLAARGVGAGDLVSAIRSVVGDEGRFRSDAAPPSGAGLNQPRAPAAPIPAGLGYVAGHLFDGRLYVTAIAADDRLRWYCHGAGHALLVVRRMQGALPGAVRASLIEMDASDVVAHPMLDGAGCTILSVHGNAASLQLRVEAPWVDARCERA